MKRLLVLLLSVLMVISLFGCGSSTPTTNESSGSAESETEEEATEPLDLTGNWEQANKGETFMSSHIEGNTIEVYWMMEDGKYLYWAGNYDAPTEDTKEYSWTSNNDTVKTGSAILASTAETKEFTYKNDRIVFDVSVQGQTSTIELVRTDTDYSAGFVATGESGSSEKKKVELIDSGYSVVDNGDGVNISYGVKISNPNPELAIDFPKIVITAKDEGGAILHNEEQVLMSIAADDTVLYAGSTYYEGKAPTTVEISVSNSKDDYSYQQGSDAIPQEAFVISNISTREEYGDHVFMGEVTNGSTKDTSIAITVIYYDEAGAIIGGTTGYTDEVEAGEKAVFEISDYSGGIEFASYEIYGLSW